MLCKVDVISDRGTCKAMVLISVGSTIDSINITVNYIIGDKGKFPFNIYTKKNQEGNRQNVYLQFNASLNVSCIMQSGQQIDLLSVKVDPNNPSALGYTKVEFQ